MTDPDGLLRLLRAHADAVVASDPAATGGSNASLTYMAVQRGSRRFGARAIATPLDAAPSAHSGWRTRYNATADAIAALGLELRLAGGRTGTLAGHWSRPKSATARAAARASERAALLAAIQHLEERGHGATAAKLRRRLKGHAGPPTP